jgi:glucose/arabinose dehydrogenase
MTWERIKGRIPGSSRIVVLVMFILALGISGCGERARQSAQAGMGPEPTLPAPSTSLIPLVKIAPAKGWPEGVTPLAAADMQVKLFAGALDHPRWLYVLPNGDLLVAETNAPERPDEGKGIKGWFMERTMKRAGAATPSANRITLLRDADGDGVAEQRSPLLQGLNSPFGMALVGDYLYVANTDALVRFPYKTGDLRITAAAEKVTDLPGGSINHHWTKNLVASPEGTRLYVAVGSNSNVAEHGMKAEEGRAAIWEIDARTGAHSIYASGLRNPVGMAWGPDGRLWVAVNERDELGSDLVPDYLTAVTPGGFYGWPYSYYGSHVDDRVKPPQPQMVAKALVPDYALGAHTASLGLAWSGGNRLPAAFAEGMFVGQHGSWNRKPLSGYKVIFVPFKGGKPNGPSKDVLTGFLNEHEEAMGRPVAVAVDKQGALLVADDVGNAIWRVTAP